jgi:hypothetical protein
LFTGENEMAVAAAVGLALVRKRHEKLKKAGAISYEMRKTAQEIGLTEGELQTVIRMRWAKKTEDNKYYAICRDGKHC